jgi:hypothetical protein
MPFNSAASVYTLAIYFYTNLARFLIHFVYARARFIESELRPRIGPLKGRTRR